MNNDIIERALATLNVGGTLLYPTDTIWGIGCDAVNPTAIERVYAIKERDHSKSMQRVQSRLPSTKYSATELTLSTHSPSSIAQ